MEKATAAVLELIESAEMRGYLKKAGDTLPLRVWLEAAAGAPAPLEKKLTVLERIVLVQTEPGARRLAEEYCRAAARALEALTRPQTPGTVFQLVQVSAAEDSNRMERDDVFLFTEWKAAQAFARAYLDELYEDEPPEEKARSWYWYELTLCRPEEGGMLRPGPYTGGGRGLAVHAGAPGREGHTPARGGLLVVRPESEPARPVPARRYPYSGLPALCRPGSVPGSGGRGQPGLLLRAGALSLPGRPGGRRRTQARTLLLQRGGADPLAPLPGILLDRSAPAGGGVSGTAQPEAPRRPAAGAQAVDRYLPVRA